MLSRKPVDVHQEVCVGIRRLQRLFPEHPLVALGVRLLWDRHIGASTLNALKVRYKVRLGLKDSDCPNTIDLLVEFLADIEDAIEEQKAEVVAVASHDKAIISAHI